jgi:hypothetical protein
MTTSQASSYANYQQLCTWGLCVINHYQLLYGTGQGKNDPPMDPNFKMSPAMLEAFNKIALGGAAAWFSYRIMYVVCLGLIKLSILVFYLSFATQKTFRTLVYALIVLVTLFTILSALLNGLECPYDPGLTLSIKIFDPRFTTRCLNRSGLYYSQAAFNMITDIIILVLPMPSLLQLRMPRVKQLLLLAVFSAGLLVPIASALRIWGLYIWADSGNHQQYSGAYMIFWAQVEINTAIMCASAPSLQPIMKRVFGKLLSTRWHNAYYYGNRPTTMVEARSIQRGVANEDSSEIALATPKASYQLQPQRGTNHYDHDVVFVLDGEEEGAVPHTFWHSSSYNTTRSLTPPSDEHTQYTPHAR